MCNEYEIIIIMKRDSIETVFKGKICTCIASSHKEECVCVRVANMVMALDNNENSNQPFQNKPVDNPEYEENKVPEDKELIKQRLMEIVRYVDSDNFNVNDQTNDILAHIRKLSSMIHMKKFKNISRKRNIEPNSSYRKLIDKAKRRKITPDHTYISSDKRAKSKTNKDGSFRKNHIPGISENF